MPAYSGSVIYVSGYRNANNMLFCGIYSTSCRDHHSVIILLEPVLKIYRFLHNFLLNDSLYMSDTQHSINLENNWNAFHVLEVDYCTTVVFASTIFRKQMKKTNDWLKQHIHTVRLFLVYI